MANGPGSCDTQCYQYGCSLHRAARPSYNYNFPDIGDRPTATFTNALRAACNQELNERRVATKVQSSDVVAGQTFIARNTVEILTDLKNRINSMFPGYINTVYTPGSTIITLAQWQEICDKILKLMRDCLCNSDCGGNLYCGCFNDCGCYYSDKSLKKNIVEIDTDDVLDKFKRISSKEWSYITEDDNVKHIGPLADDIENEFPDAVLKDADGNKMLRTSDMIGILWTVIQKQQKEIDRLNSYIFE